MWFLVLIPTVWALGWLPVASVSTLRDLTPTRVTLMNRDYVVWRDGKTWIVQNDACPHRLAPLSQGRVSQGCIECPYHGWQFDAGGEATRVPQATRSVKHAKLATLETRVKGDLVWARFDSEEPEANTPTDVPADVPDYPPLRDTPNAHYFVRELPYSWDVLIENFMDPAHIPFAHHSLQATRSDGSPIAMRLAAFNATHCELGFNDRIMNRSREGVISFEWPCYYHFRTSNGRRPLDIFSVPIRPGWSRVFIRPPFSHPILPDWVVHVMTNRFLNTDVWLHDVERTMRLERPTPRLCTPTSSDLGPNTWRRWWRTARLDRHAVFGAARNLSPRALTYAAQVDVWNQHSRMCSACRRIAQRCKTAQRVAVALSFARAFAPSTRLRMGMVALSLILFWLSTWIRTEVGATRQQPIDFPERSVAVQ